MRRKEDREYDAAQRKEDRDYDASQRREDRERADQLRRTEDEKWERRRREEQRQREDDDAKQQVTIEFLPGGPLSQPQQATITSDGITHRIFVTAPAAYPVKQVDAQIVYHTNSGLGQFPPGWTFGPPSVENGQVRYTCYAGVSPEVHDAAPIVRFTDRNGHLYYSLHGHTQRFPHDADWVIAATEIDRWLRLGPSPDDADS